MELSSQLEIIIPLVSRECECDILHTEPQECFEVILIILNFLYRSMLARDLQSVALYDQEGKFVGVRRPSSKLPMDIDGMKIVIEDAIGSTGLDLKVNN